MHSPGFREWLHYYAIFHNVAKSDTTPTSLPKLATYARSTHQVAARNITRGDDQQCREGVKYAWAGEESALQLP